MKKEPAAITLAVAYVLLQILRYLEVPYVPDTDTINSIAEFFIMIGSALYIRAKVFSEKTIRKAGLTPDQIERMANNPLVTEAVGP